MKHLLKYLVLTAAASMLIVGCGDDEPTTPPTTNDPTYVQFKANDKYTYNYYPHDVNDNRDNSGKLVKVWTVLSVNNSVGGRTGVALVQEMTYQSDGVTAVGAADTFEFHSATDGKFSQFNLLKAVVKRIPSADAFLGDVPERWVQVGDTKTTGTTTWQSIEGGPVTDTVVILSQQTVVKLSIPATHKGKQSITVPSGTYANSYHTDHKVLIDVKSTLLNASDTLSLSYDIAPAIGVVRQSLGSRTFSATAQQVPGFDMELVSITHAP